MTSEKRKLKNGAATCNKNSAESISSPVTRHSSLNLGDDSHLSIYIHIPYCLKKCPYCNFNSYPITRGENIPDEYIEALIAELKMQTDRYLLEKKRLKSIYFGGGTPSLLNIHQVEKIINSIKLLFNIKDLEKLEVTLEVNPGTASPEKLSKFHEVGINRLIIGVQSFKERDLKILGRIHRVKEAAQLLENLELSNFKNFGIDLIFGIPKQSLSDWLYNLKTAVSFKPKHISAYNLTIEGDTPFSFLASANKWKFPSENLEFKMFLLGSEYLKKLGYRHYEISNFAKRGFESVHNKNYWKRGSYIGAGAGAHSFIKEQKLRFSNIKDPVKYISMISRGDSSINFQEIVDGKKEFTEKILLSLRMDKSIKFEEIRLGRKNKEVLGFFDKCENHGYLKRTKDGFHLTTKGYFVSNEIIAKLSAFI